MIVPKLTELEAEIRQDLEQSLGIAAVFQKKAINAFAAVQAAKLKTYYLSVAKVQKNIFADSADSENVGGTLERFGRVKIERNPFPATQGIYDATITGTIGGTITQGLTFRNILNNSVYEVVDTVILTSTTGTIRLISLSAGRDFLLNINDKVVATAPIVNVQSEATISAVITEPQNEENLETYRALVLQAYRTEPQGGASSDYRIWASDVQGVVKVYPYAGSQAGVINLYVEADTVDRIPTQEILDELKEAIEFDPDDTKPLNERGRRPLSAWTINYLPVTPQQVDIDIVGLDDSSASVLSTITSAVEIYLNTIRPFVAGADDPNEINDTLRSSELTRIIQQSISTNNFFESLVVKVATVTVNSYKFEFDKIPNLGTIAAI